MTSYMLVLSIILSTESRIETYDYKTQEECRIDLPNKVKEYREFYKEADILGACLAKMSYEELK